MYELLITEDDIGSLQGVRFQHRFKSMGDRTGHYTIFFIVCMRRLSTLLSSGWRCCRGVSVIVSSKAFIGSCVTLFF